MKKQPNYRNDVSYRIVLSKFMNKHIEGEGERGGKKEVSMYKNELFYKYHISPKK